METKKRVKKDTGKKQPGKPPRKTRPRETGKAFHIVGIGASAGGLEALEQFLKHTSEGKGMAFVIVQHLDPTHKGILPELLQRMTSLKVEQVADRTPVRPDTVYVIPPNKDMSILHGILHLLEPASPRGFRLPIDFFFRALAEDQQERSTGIILSGMGTDGTLGIKAIKEKNGIVLVQDPASAQFDGMPRSAAGTGLADYIAPPQDLFDKLIDLLHFPPLPHTKEAEPPLDSTSKSAQEKIIILIRSHTGHDFSFYKKGTLLRRIERRMGVHQISRIDQYVKLLQANPQEQDILFKELLIGVTNFFRDPQAWELMKDQAIPELIASRPEGCTLRAWVAGCSTGEEAYSLAMVFKEALEKIKPKARFALQIYATDLDCDAINRARQGIYPANISADVSPERLKRFFIKEDNDNYRVVKEIREMVILATQNIIMDPPFTKLDILICRNLLIYLVPEIQKKLLPLFHYSLNPGGILFLGNSETVNSFTDLFTPLEGKWRIYRRNESPRRAELTDFPSSFFSHQSSLPREAESSPRPAENLQPLIDKLIMEQYSPAAVLVNSKGDVLYISGRTGKYLEPAAGKANWNIFAMAREGIRYELTHAFRQAVREKGQTAVHGLKLGVNGASQVVDLTVRYIEAPAELKGMYMIIFQDVKDSEVTKSSPPPLKGHSLSKVRIMGLEQENKHLVEELQKTREEMQTSQEELKATNEELQSTNEELQSSNEELTTSKEEMQSMNEELQTVNAELQSKVEELSRSNNDMKNLLNSTDIATLFLDKECNLKRFTTRMTSILKLKQRDVGRPITDISSDLIYNEMAEDIHQVLQTLVFVEKQVITHDGRWYTVRIMPYRTLEDKIDGVVITFTDVTTAKKLEMELRRVNELIEAKIAEGAKELIDVKAELQAEIAKQK